MAKPRSKKVGGGATHSLAKLQCNDTFSITAITLNFTLLLFYKPIIVTIAVMNQSRHMTGRQILEQSGPSGDNSNRLRIINRSTLHLCVSSSTQLHVLPQK